MQTQEISVYLYKLTRVLSISLLSLVIYYLINIGNNFVQEDKQIRINRKIVVPTALTIIGVLIVYGLFKKYSILSDTFFTIVFSIILAYLFNPIIKRFEKRGIPRFWSVIILYLIILGVILIFAFLIVPKTGKEIKKFIYNMPFYMNKVSGFIDRMGLEFDKLVGDLPLSSGNLYSSLKGSLSGVEKVIITGVKGFFGGIMDIFSTAVSLVLTPILTLYFLVDKEYFIDMALGLIPDSYMDDSMDLFKQMDRALSLFVRGRLLMAAYVGVSITLVLLVLKVDFALAIGFITGFADIIPYIGPFLGFIPAVFFALLDSPIKALWVSILFLLIQWTENNVLAPKIIGESTGLHPMTVLLAIIIGGGMFGVFGMILSIPFVSIVIILYNFIKEKYMDRKNAKLT